MAVNGYGVLPQRDLSELERAATVIVAGTRAAGVLDAGELDLVVAEALRAAQGRARMVSLYTGSFVLAAAGLLEGWRAATHWRYARQFRRLFPAVDLDTHPLYIADRGVLTSAGGAAAIDLCLHVIRDGHGSSGEPDLPLQRRRAPARQRAGAVHRPSGRGGRGDLDGQGPRVDGAASGAQGTSRRTAT